MIQELSENLLDTFANTHDSSDRVRALTELMTIKALPKRAEDTRFSLGLDQWVRIANEQDAAPRERLLAIAELIRSTQQLKKRQPSLIRRVSPAFETTLPPLALLEDPEARLNVARACSMVDAKWLQSYRAASIAEETAPKPRAEMMEGLIANASSISEVLDCLQAPFAGLHPNTETPAESVARRLTKTLEIFRVTVLNSLLDAGTDVGKKLDIFIRSTFTATGRPKDESVQIELTGEVALTLHDLVRSRFSLATEPQTFEALQYCRTFFSGISWPKDVQSSTNLLVQDISEALVMLGRMGVPNQDLLNRLDLVCGIKDRARFVAMTLAEKHSEIDESIRVWMRTGRMPNIMTTSEVLEESLLASVDEALGLALIEARVSKEHRDSERRLVSSLEIFDSNLVSVAKGLASQSFAMSNSIEDLAKRRGLDLLGSVGEEIDFSPKYFESLITLRGTRVVIHRPAVVKRTPNGTVGAVVKKGLVE